VFLLERPSSEESFCTFINSPQMAKATTGVFWRDARLVHVRLALFVLLVVPGTWRVAASLDTPSPTTSERAEATLYHSIDDTAATAEPPRPTSPPALRLAVGPSFAGGGGNSSAPLLLRRQEAASQFCGFWSRWPSKSCIALLIPRPCYPRVPSSISLRRVLRNPFRRSTKLWGVLRGAKICTASQVFQRQL
jgi:hypothetical protein